MALRLSFRNALIGFVFALAIFLFGWAPAQAQVFGQNQILPSSYFGDGFLISTSTSGTHKLGASLVDLAGSWITGILGASNGGTGVSSFGGTNTVLYTTAANTLSSEAAFIYNPSTNTLSADVIGVGTTSPSIPLAVVGNSIGLYSTGNANIIIDNGGTNRLGSMTYSTAGTPRWYTGTPDSDVRGDGTEYFVGTSNSDPKLWIESSGNVGIGTSTPGTLLTVAGTTTASCFSTNGGTSCLGGGTVSSVGMTVPTGLTISGSPITTSGTLALEFDTGYGIPTTAKQTEWDTAYTNRITSATYPLQIAANTISLAFGTTTSNTWAGTQTFGTIVASIADFTAGILRATYSAALSLATNGDIGIDSTSNQFRYYSGGASRVLGDGNFYPAFSYATTTAWTGTTTLALGPAYVGETWNGAKCFTDTGTLAVIFGDGTNSMNAVVATSTVGATTLNTNNTFTASEKRYVSIGSPASSPTSISCTISKSLTAD